MRLFGILILTAVLTSCNEFNSEQGFIEALNLSADETSLNVSTYKDCNELRSELKKDYKIRKSIWAEASRISTVESAAQPDNAEDNTTEDSVTNNQEPGIDEADIVKRSEDQIFVATKNTVHIIDRASKKLLGSLKLTEYTAPQDEIESTLLSLQVVEDRLIIQGPTGENSYRISVFSLSPSAMPEKRWTHDIVGKMIDSRLVKGRLFIVSNYRDQDLEDFSQDPENFSFPFSEKSHLHLPVHCDAIIRRPNAVSSRVLTTIQSINILGDGSEFQQIHLLGSSSEEIYMGTSQILLYTANHFRLSNDRTSIITRVDYQASTGDLEAIGRVQVSGNVGQGQWAFKQLSADHSAVVTTSANPIQTSERTHENYQVGRNHLFILSAIDQELKIASSVINFGKPREDVRSVRYIDNHAYVVTFRTTDPLYSINLAEPLKPRMEDALEIPGFSSYMHPIADHLLVGIGYSDQWNSSIQLGLFDISDTQNLEPLDRMILGTHGSSSVATHNHHAFFSNPDTGIFGFPLIERAPYSEEASFNEIENKAARAFIGFLLMKVDLGEDEQPKLEEVIRLDHRDLMPIEFLSEIDQQYSYWLPHESFDITRVFQEGEQIVTVSRFGIKYHDPKENYDAIYSVKF